MGFLGWESIYHMVGVTNSLISSSTDRRTSANSRLVYWLHYNANMNYRILVGLSIVQGTSSMGKRRRYVSSMSCSQPSRSQKDRRVYLPYVRLRSNPHRLKNRGHCFSWLTIQKRRLPSVRYSLISFWLMLVKQFYIINHSQTCGPMRQWNL